MNNAQKRGGGIACNRSPDCSHFKKGWEGIFSSREWRNSNCNISLKYNEKYIWLVLIALQMQWLSKDC